MNDTKPRQLAGGKISLYCFPVILNEKASKQRLALL